MSIIAPARRVNLLPAGIVAGIIGGIVIDIFLLIATRVSVVIFYQSVASALVGKAAFAGHRYVLLGLAIHFAISIAWGIIYALAAQSGRPALVNRPVTSGIIFGLVVWVVMTLLQVPVHLYQPPRGMILVMGLVSHCIFFGLPIALYVSNAARRALG